MQADSGKESVDSGTERATRKRTCIICGEKANSAEHVFPSALGGRRKNKGIYCHSHNNWFGSYVAVLQDQLSFINAQLEVQPDRGNAKPFVAIDKHGRRLELLGADIKLAPDLDQVLDNSMDGSLQAIQMDPALVRALQERAGKRGLTLHINESSKCTEWQTDPVSVRLVLGGEHAMRAVSYLAITFAAHFWPDVARSEGLAAIKAILWSGGLYNGDDHVVESPSVTEFVHWTSVEESGDLPGPHSVVGHTIVVCVSNRKLVSYVSLFNALRFRILLGDCDSMDKSIITQIDPLQTGFGSDWKVDRLDYAVLFEVVRPTPLAADVLESDKMQLAMMDLFARVQRVQLSREYARGRKELEMIASLDSQARIAAARSFVQQQRQRILNLVLHLAKEAVTDRVGILVK